ncbi:VOC family protein [Candidatus Nomurabacteria bacterium]|nr:VOC family protein [Candidatus Nomurabacteria bacterium]
MPSPIKHIEFWVSNLENSLKFYEGLFAILGWEEFEEKGFVNGETKIYFMEQPVSFNQNIGPRHICFLAESREVVEQMADFLKANNSVIIRGPIDSNYKDRSSYTVDFKDPDGYILEVATKSEVSFDK